MNIRQVIELKYDDLVKYCRVDCVRRVEIQTGGINDFEEMDLLHSMLLIFLKKYKDVEFETLEYGYFVICREFLTEKNKYSKMNKKKQLLYVDVEEGSDFIDGSDFNDI